MFIATSELVIPAETKTNESNTEAETQPATIEDRIRNVSTQLKYLHVFLYFFTHYIIMFYFI